MEKQCSSGNGADLQADPITRAATGGNHSSLAYRDVAVQLGGP